MIHLKSSSVLCTPLLFIASFLFLSPPGEFSRQINDFKIKLQKAEQDNARLEGLVSITTELIECVGNIVMSKKEFLRL